MEKKVYFVTGIDTNVGKSYATGFIAKKFITEGYKTITQKFIQTGCVIFSEDIAIHRKIMELEDTDEDKNFLTMPEILSYPASPHLAAKIDKREIDLKKIDNATQLLLEKYDRILLEGAGGIMVPITEEYLTIDYIAEKQYPLIFVTSGKLGSINHTLLSFEAIKKRNIQIEILAYNEFYGEGTEDPIIANDTLNFINNILKKEFPSAKIVKIPKI